jgi:hypothetical protein
VQTAYHDRCTPTPSRRCAKEGGPSAGVAMVRSPFFFEWFDAKMKVAGLVQVCAIVSLLMDMYVPPTTAMTGEVRIGTSPLHPL